MATKIKSKSYTVIVQNTVQNTGLQTKESGSPLPHNNAQDQLFSQSINISFHLFIKIESEYFVLHTDVCT